MHMGSTLCVICCVVCSGGMLGLLRLGFWVSLFSLYRLLASVLYTCFSKHILSGEKVCLIWLVVSMDDNYNSNFHPQILCQGAGNVCVTIHGWTGDVTVTMSSTHTLTRGG